MTSGAHPRKKLIEVALPLVSINDACAYEGGSYIRKHPRNLHKWWAQRRLASARAVLFCSIIDDPSNDLTGKSAEKERERLFSLIKRMVQWDNTYDKRLFEDIREEIRKATKGKMPIIIDPFCGGGSIPVEAQRLGLSVAASDLNPVSVLITKALVEIPTRFNGKPPVNPDAVSNRLKAEYKGVEGLTSDIIYYARRIRVEAEKRIGYLYPKIKEKTVIAWIWARAVTCPNPACGVEMPLVRSFELAKKESKRVWIEPNYNKKSNSISYHIKSGKGSAPKGTITKKGARCIACDTAIPLDYIRNEGREGRVRYRMIGIVAEGDKKKTYHDPSTEHADITSKAIPQWEPETAIPEQALGFRVQLYGLTKHRDLFTKRQLVALTTLSDLVSGAHRRVMLDAIRAGLKDDGIGLDQGGSGATAYADAITTYLAFAVDRCAEMWTTLSGWMNDVEAVGHTFLRQTLSMSWDFNEANPFSDSRGSWESSFSWIAENIQYHGPGVAIVRQLDAAKALPTDRMGIVCTDPPYYDNIAYADLSDFFYVWLRPILGKIYPAIFSTLLTPKEQELIANPYRFGGDEDKAKDHFLTNLQNALVLVRKQQNPEYPITIYYAFKETESDNDSDETMISSTGWETILTSIINAKLQITGTWPIRTERQSRMRAIASNALASSVVLVCRPRNEDAPLATRREFVSTLKKELPNALMKLQHSNIAPVDLAQAAIGPGMAVFSKYSKVIEADGSQMTVKTALQIINQELDTYLNAQETEMDQETRFCLTWFEQYGMEAGSFGEADVLAKAKNTAIDRLAEAFLVLSRAGKVRLLKRAELPKNLDISNLERLSIWLCTQELIRKLEVGGEDEAAKLILKIGAGQSESAKDLAYQLYSICQKKNWNEEALSFNNLVTSWPAIQEKAGLGSLPPGQTRL